MPTTNTSKTKMETYPTLIVVICSSLFLSCVFLDVDVASKLRLASSSLTSAAFIVATDLESTRFSFESTLLVLASSSNFVRLMPNSSLVHKAPRIIVTIAMSHMTMSEMSNLLELLFKETFKVDAIEEFTNDESLLANMLGMNRKETVKFTIDELRLFFLV